MAQKTAGKTQQELDKKLLEAARNGKTNEVRKLLNAGASIETRNAERNKEFMEAFASSVEGNKVGTKKAASILAEGLLKDIPFNAKNPADAAEKRKLIGHLAKAMSVKKEDFFVDCMTPLSDAKDKMRASGKMPSISKAVSVFMDAAHI